MDNQLSPDYNSDSDSEYFVDLLIHVLSDSELLFSESIENNNPTFDVEKRIIEDPKFAEFVGSSINLLLLKVNINKLSVSYSVMRDIFSLLKRMRFFSCAPSVFTWLNKNYHIIYSNDFGKNVCFFEGLNAFSSIQWKDEKLEKFWLDLLVASSPKWTPIVFIGLFRQNAQLASNYFNKLLRCNDRQIEILMSFLFRSNDILFIKYLTDKADNNDVVAQRLAKKIGI
jgi:hypothetical protein